MKSTRFIHYSFGSLAKEIKDLKEGEVITLSDGRRLKCYLHEEDSRTSRWCFPAGKSKRNVIGCYFSNFYIYGKCPLWNFCHYKKKGARRKRICVRFIRIRGEGKKKV